MAFHVRYNAAKQCWEGSSDGGAFFDITENHFVPTRQGAYFDFVPYSDDYPVSVHPILYAPDNGDAVIGTNWIGGRLAVSRRHLGSVLPENSLSGPTSTILMQPSRKVDAPPVSNPGEARLYFDRSTNKLRISENGGAYVDMI